MSPKTACRVLSILFAALTAGCGREKNARKAPEDTFTQEEPVQSREQQELESWVETLEEDVAENGTNIKIITTEDGETIGWKDLDTGALSLSAEKLPWPAEMPAAVPQFTENLPNGINIDPQNNIVLLYPKTGKKAVTDYINEIRKTGWGEVRSYEDDTQIIYEGMKGTATLSVLYAGGSLVISFNH